jgi:hypothetical protein
MDSVLTDDSAAITDTTYTFDYLSAFRWSWLIDGDIDKSWFDEAAKRQRRALSTSDAEHTLPGQPQPIADERQIAVSSFPCVRMGQPGATRIFTSWINGGVVTQITSGDMVPQWFVLSGVELRRFAVLVGQFLALVMARKYLHAPSVRLIKTQPIFNEAVALYDSNGEQYVPKGRLRDRVESLSFLGYSNLGGAILRAALHPYALSNNARCSRLEVRLPFSREQKAEWTQSDSAWARSLSDAFYAKTKGALL